MLLNCWNNWFFFFFFFVSSVFFFLSLLIPNEQCKRTHSYRAFLLNKETKCVDDPTDNLRFFITFLVALAMPLSMAIIASCSIYSPFKTLSVVYLFLPWLFHSANCMHEIVECSWRVQKLKFSILASRCFSFGHCRVFVRAPTNNKRAIILNTFQTTKLWNLIWNFRITTRSQSTKYFSFEWEYSTDGYEQHCKRFDPRKG